MTMGTRLKGMRQVKGWSQAEVADQLVISRQSISKWELDQSLPDLTMLKKLAILYDFSLDELLQLKEEKIMALTGMTAQDMAEKTVTLLCPNQVPTETQITFLEEKFFIPISHQLAPEKVLWQTVIPALPTGVGSNLSADCPTDTEESQLYQQYFRGDNGYYLILTAAGLFKTTPVEWFETKKLKRILFAELEILAIAPYFNVKHTMGNKSALFYGKKNGNYDLFAIQKPAAEALTQVMTYLDPEAVFFKQYTKLYGLKLSKLWRKKKRLTDE